MADETAVPNQEPAPAAPETEGSLLETMYPAETETPEVEAAEAPEVEAESAEVVEEVELSSLKELVEHFGLDPDWVENLRIETKVNGQVGAVSLAELKANYQKWQAGDAYLKEAKQKAEKIVAEAVQKRDEVTGTAAALAEMLQGVEAEIESDVKAIDWNKLRVDDPAEYAAKKAEIKERRERLDKWKAEAAKRYQEAAQKAHEQQMEALQKALPQEREVLLERIPEWADEEKSAAEKSEVVKYLMADGFSEDDVKVAAFNGKLLALAVKAMRYDAAKAKRETVQKKLVRIPKKVLKPGAKTEQPKTNGAQSLDPATILYG